MNWEVFISWTLEEIVIFTPNFTKFRCHIFDKFEIFTITISEQPRVTLSQSEFVNAKPLESCLENVSDWLSSLPQKGELLALKLNQMNRYGPWWPVSTHEHDEDAQI